MKLFLIGVVVCVTFAAVAGDYGAGHDDEHEDAHDHHRHDHDDGHDGHGHHHDHTVKDSTETDTDSSNTQDSDSTDGHGHGHDGRDGHGHGHDGRDHDGHDGHDHGHDRHDHGHDGHDRDHHHDHADSSDTSGLPNKDSTTSDDGSGSDSSSSSDDDRGYYNKGYIYQLNKYNSDGESNTWSEGPCPYFWKKVRNFEDKGIPFTIMHFHRQKIRWCRNVHSHGCLGVCASETEKVIMKVKVPYRFRGEIRRNPFVHVKRCVHYFCYAEVPVEFSSECNCRQAHG